MIWECHFVIYLNRKRSCDIYGSYLANVLYVIVRFKIMLLLNKKKFRLVIPRRCVVSYRVFCTYWCFIVVTLLLPCSQRSRKQYRVFALITPEDGVFYSASLRYLRTILNSQVAQKSKSACIKPLNSGTIIIP